ncbi:MAG: SapC family protein [Parvularculaceae bacterium]
MSQVQGTPQITGKMFLFERPELLNKEQHGGLGISKPEQPCKFCAKARAIPLTVSEVASAMKDFPIVFLSPDTPIPLAITGLIDDINLFVDEKGNWEENRYVPGYLRRYPFAVASETGADDRMAIVIDTGYEGVVPGGDMPLFDNGEPTQATNQAIEFCKSYEQDRRLTDNFMNKLKEFDLITSQAAQFTPAGEQDPQPFAQYFGVDEKRLNDLPDDKYIELRKSTLLPLLYAQLMSMGNWRGLLQRRAKRFSLSEDQIVKQSGVN